MSIVKQLESYIKSNLPEAEILAWMGTLADEEREQLQEHALELARRATIRVACL